METDAIARPFAYSHWPRPVKKGKGELSREMKNWGDQTAGMN